MCQKRKIALSQIKEQIFDLNIHAIIIPSADPHQSEYLPAEWKMREWISGFTGSAGTLVITRDRAGLWTDSRYFLQAEEELAGTGIELFRQGLPNVPPIEDFIVSHLNTGDVVSLNGRLWSHSQVKNLREKLKKAGLEVNTKLRIIEEVWSANNRPTPSEREVFVHKLEYACTDVNDKLSQVRRKMSDLNVKEHLITTLDDIAWLYNLRGHDVEYNPVFLSYAVVKQDEALFFIDSAKITNEVTAQLSNHNITLRPYQAIDKHLQDVEEPILVNPDDCNDHLYQLIQPDLRVDGQSITRALKAIKSSAEVAQIDSVMIKDGLALTEAFYHLYQKIGEITEAEFATVIAHSRSKKPDYFGESFPAIVGYQGNGAIVHYRPQKDKSAVIAPEGLLLCDSGGQYLNGTTDITRTIAVGPVTPAQAVSYTRVLKGHIAIDQAIFPEGTTGSTLDPLARQYLWRNGQNYGHGTGHGVGYFLNVHEPPQGISPGSGSRATTQLVPGMLTSNEPGYYERGSYGIRIENLILCEQSHFEGYLKHRHLTLFPIDTSLIDLSLMSKEELDWVNTYHNLVLTKLLPHLDGPLALWLEKSCRRIPVS